MRIRRGELTDLYVEGERSVVMVGESVLVLSEIATRIVLAVPEVQSVGLEEVTAAIVASFGEPDPPATAAELTLEKVHELAAHEVLVVEEDLGPSSSLRYSGAPADVSEAAEKAAAVDALRGALRHLVSDDPTPWTAPLGIDSQALVAAAHQHHVVPFLAAGLDRLALSARTGAELQVAAGRARAGADVLAADLARAIDVLEARGVRALTFKGIALATQAYGDFSARGAGDIDLLVAPRDLESAHLALARAGWRPSPGYPSPGASWGWRHFVRTDNELPLTNRRTMIDLHWHLAPTRDTFPPFDALWVRRQMVEVDGRRIPTISAYDALAHSAGHAAKDRWKWLRSLLDVHQLAVQRETWEGADRPLRHDQLITLGLSLRMFGESSGMPSVAYAAVELTDQVWDAVLAEQSGAAAVHEPFKVPGHTFVRSMRTTARTGGRPSEAMRLFGRSALPPWLTADDPSPHAAIAIPRVLTRRAREVFAKALTARA